MNGHGASTWHIGLLSRSLASRPSGAKLLIDDSATAWLRTPTYAVGSIGRDRTIENAPVDVLIEFTERSIDVASTIARRVQP